MKTATDLEKFVWQRASEQLDVSKPFPFLVKGTPAQVCFHIVNKLDTTPHDPEQHDQIKARFELRDQPIEIIGFGSDKHEDVFTHYGSKTHMHMKTQDDTSSGHVDELELKGAMALLLPELKM